MRFPNAWIALRKSFSACGDKHNNHNPNHSCICVAPLIPQTNQPDGLGHVHTRKKSAKRPTPANRPWMVWLKREPPVGRIRSALPACRSHMLTGLFGKITIVMWMTTKSASQDDPIQAQKISIASFGQWSVFQKICNNWRCVATMNPAGQWSYNNTTQGGK